MKDDDLARKKIIEKRSRRRAIAERFREIILQIPDFREYSRVPEAERVAAAVTQERRKVEAARTQYDVPCSPEEHQARVELLEKINELPPAKRPRELPGRPDYFFSEADHHTWCVKFEGMGGTLSEEDRRFVETYEAAMTPEQRDRWQYARENGGE